MTRIAAAILIAIAAGAPSHAGDGAAVDVVGFSADGRYFAFEQYGEYDVCGGLYASITAIEIPGDRLVKGWPVQVMMDDDDPRFDGKEPRDKLLRDLRARAAADAAPLTAQLKIAMPGQLLIASRESQARTLLGHEQVKSVRKAVVTTMTLPADLFGADTRLVLREFDIALPRCKDQVTGDHPAGFALTLERKGGPTIHLSRDQTIPTARGCPDHYGLAEVHALRLPDGGTALAVLIQYFYLASHGPDRRFLAVTGRVP